jgi:hypothetical protein
MRVTYHFLDKFAYGGTAAGSGDFQLEMEIVADVCGQADVSIWNLP